MTEKEMEQGKIQKISFIQKHKRAITILSLLIIIAAMINVYFFIRIESGYTINKNRSRSAIINIAKKRLSIKAIDLSKDDYEKITVLDIGGKNITDISILEKFKNLHRLTLFDISITEQDIPKWTKFLAKYNIVKSNELLSLDISPLKNLTKLQSLKIEGTPIKNGEVLKNLINLQELRLNSIPVSDIDFIKSLTSLKKLYISETSFKIKGAPFDDAINLKDLTNLEELSLRYTSISNLEPIKSLTNLKVLDIGSTSVTNLEPIINLSNLESLQFRRTKVSNIEPLSNLTNLFMLHLENTPVSNLEPLRGLTNLSELGLQRTQVDSLEPLKGLKNLFFLDIRDCKNITDEQVEDLQKALPGLMITR